jgi:hypothetical protein
MSLYKEMTALEHERQRKDLLYHILVNTEAETLNDICSKIQEHVLKTYDETNMSKRLKLMLKKACQHNDRVAKHALIFFALNYEPDIRDIFMADTPRVPPEKFQYYIKSVLPMLIEKLGKGAFTSLRAFVEDARWTYATL